MNKSNIEKIFTYHWDPYQHVVKTNKINTFTLYYSTVVGKTKLLYTLYTILLELC